MPAKKAAKKAVKTAAKKATKKVAKKAAGTAATKSTEAKPAKKAAKKAGRTPKSGPSTDQIAEAAYLNYRRRVQDSLPGNHESDWLKAEEQLSDKNQPIG